MGLPLLRAAVAVRPKREQLADEYRRHPLSLSLYMSSHYVLAIDD